MRWCELACPSGLLSPCVSGMCLLLDARAIVTKVSDRARNPLITALPRRVFLQCGLVAGGISPPLTRTEVRRFLGLLPRPVAAAEGRERTQRNQFAGSKRGETHSQSARRFFQKAKVYQTQRRVGFPDPMGAWCIWPRPQAESVATQTYQQMRARSL